MFFKKPINISTFAKYLFSYIAIFSVLIGGFFLILRSQLETQYYNQRTDQILQQLSSLGAHIDSEIAFLAQTDSLISSNADIAISTYISDSRYYRNTNDELIQYVKSSNLIKSIVYRSSFSGHIFSTTHYVTYRDGIFTLTDSALHTVEFDPAPYLDSSVGQLVWLANNEASCLLYFPSTKNYSSSTSFYILDTGVLQSQLKSLLSAEVIAVALTDSQGNCVTSINFDDDTASLHPLTQESGIYSLGDSRAVCVSKSIRSGFSIVAIISEDFLLDQVNSAFMTSYWSLLLLSIFGIILVYGAMFATYKPLQRLTQSVNPDPTNGKNYLALLSQNISQLNTQKQQLQQNLDNYRTFVQKELLGSSLSQQHAIEPALLDRIFDAASGADQIFIVKTACPHGSLPRHRITEQLTDAIGQIGSCFCLNMANTGTFHLFLLKESPEAPAIIKETCSKLHQEHGYLFALSNLSGSIMDIPLLYENAESACSLWPQTPIAEFRSSELASDPHSYPHELLNQLSMLLQENQFSQARNSVQEIFDNMDAHSAQCDLPAYFPNCIVLDLLTILTNSMSRSKINFEDYSTILQEAIRLSRHYQPSENSTELLSLISELLYFYEKEAINRLSHVAPLQTLMEEHFCQPEFSISVIAEIYHVSISRMSVLFKKEIGLGFADCLWQMRLKKAIELLTATDLPIDEISATVGYLNPNSFRRKFKQETGFSPSQFRDMRSNTTATND